MLNQIKEIAQGASWMVQDGAIGTGICHIKGNPL
jgi:hypothetical protein